MRASTRELSNAGVHARTQRCLKFFIQAHRCLSLGTGGYLLLLRNLRTRFNRLLLPLTSVTCVARGK
eukprot:4816349-Pyramimonas_sp.AAC.1